MRNYCGDEALLLNTLFYKIAYIYLFVYDREAR